MAFPDFAVYNASNSNRETVIPIRGSFSKQFRRRKCMKKLLSVLLAMTMALSFAACSGSAANSSAAAPANSTAGKAAGGDSGDMTVVGFSQVGAESDGARPTPPP